MDRNKFIQSSTRIRIQEKKLLKSENFIRLAEQESLEDTLRALSDTVYNEYINKLTSPTKYEQMLSKELVNTYRMLYELSPESAPVDMVSLKYFYHNLKVLVKEEIEKEDFTHIYVDVGDFDIKGFREVFQKESSKDKYEEMLLKAKKLYEDTKNPQIIDVYLDKEYFKELLEIAEKSEVDLFIRYAKNLIDFTNIRTLLRVKAEGEGSEYLSKVLIDGGNIAKDSYYYLLKADVGESETLKKLEVYKYVKKGLENYKEKGTLTDFELEMDNFFVDLIKEVKYTTFGPEVIFAFALAKEMEIKNLRIVLVAKLNGLDKEFIRGKLRDNYV